MTQDGYREGQQRGHAPPLTAVRDLMFSSFFTIKTSWKDFNAKRYEKEHSGC